MGKTKKNEIFKNKKINATMKKMEFKINKTTLIGKILQEFSYSIRGIRSKYSINRSDRKLNSKKVYKFTYNIYI